MVDFQFRRQHSIGNYIVDFCCPSEKLIIELDGNPQGDYIQIEKDKKRDRYLEELGFTVLRFENRFVFQDQVLVTEEIRRVLKKLKNQPPRPERKICNYHCISIPATPP